MDRNEIEMRLADANRIRCVSNRTDGRYKLRIEDVDGAPLTPFVERTRSETRHALQLSILLGWTLKENLSFPEYGVEDYRMPIVNEDMLRARLYPAA